MKQDFILLMNVDVTSLEQSIYQVVGWDENHVSSYVCVSNVHM